MTSRLRAALTGLAVGAGFALGAGTAQAATINWDLSLGSNPAADSANFTSGGITITAAGFTSTSALLAGTPNAQLFFKSPGGDEVGLGLTNDPSGDNEISGTNLIRIDFSNAVSAGLTNFDFTFGSTTDGESWAVFGSNSATSGFTQLMTGTTETEFTLPGTPDNFYYFAATDGNVLLSSVSGVSAVPLPAALPLFASGLGFLGFAGWRKRRKSAAVAAA